MTYRDLIDIPEIPWIPHEERFRQPVVVDAAQAPRLHRVVGRPAKSATPREALRHREPDCTGNWRDKTVNKFGRQVVECGKCGATRITKRGDK
ncbi:MAG TPA: hypothetical protein VIZ18_09130 [Ktedonobacteraceae bacterium]